MAAKAVGVLSGIQQLGTRASRDCGYRQWCAHTWLLGPSAGPCAVAGASCRHVHSSEGQGQQQEWGPDAGSLAVVGALAVGMHCWVLAGSTAVEAGVEIQAGACKHTAGGLAAGEPCGAGQQ